jgi:sulfur carrier protein
VKIRVNGEERILNSSISIAEFIEEELDGRETRGIALAVNEAIVPKQKWDTTMLSEGDRVEIVHAVQGG